MAPTRAPRVVLLGPPTDPQVQAVGAALRELGSASITVNLADIDAGAPWALHARSGRARLEHAGVRWERVRAVYVRQVPAAWPPVGTAGDGEAMVLSRWLGPFMQAKEREAVALGWLLELERRGVALLNPPFAGSLAQNKPFQLTRAAALGLPVPRTCITNQVAEAEAFIRSVGRAIAKPVQGGALTVPLDAETLGRRAVRARLQRIQGAPVTLQERVDGDDVRLMLLEGRVLSCLAIRLPGKPVLDFRGSAAYQQGRARYQHVALPGAVLRQAAQWAKACGLTFAGVDLKRTARGRWVFLECNSSPIYLDGERKSGDPISAGLAGWLAQHST